MTKAKMIETLQQMETETWEELIKYEFENMPPCTTTEEIHWHLNDKGYRNILNKWNGIREAINKCGIEKLPNKEAYELLKKIYYRNKKYREKLKAGA